MSTTSTERSGLTILIFKPPLDQITVICIDMGNLLTTGPIKKNQVGALLI
ncbi:MAG: hypothetical protein ACJ74Z_01220 [Bryobacteraceae bacterium]